VGALAPLVEERIELNDIEGANEPRIVQHLHDEVRLAIGCAARHGRADARRQRRIEEIGIDADMQDAVALGDPVEDAPQQRACSLFVDKPHVDNVDALASQ
jgi:hypothetical protein